MPKNRNQPGSDCHAWSASPVYYFLSLIAGIQSAEPGFKSVRIEPHLGQLNWIDASMPHRLGTIKVNFKKEGSNHITGQVILPDNLTGELILNDQKTVLKSGINNIK